jgi:hypothetical protein
LQSNAHVAPEHELEITKPETDDEPGVDLGQHGVFRVAAAGLDLQVRRDEAAEELGPPAFFADAGDGLGAGEPDGAAGEQLLMIIGLPASAGRGFQLAKMRSRNKFAQLLKDGMTRGPSPNSLFCLVSYS